MTERAPDKRVALVVDDDRATRLPAAGVLKKLGVDSLEARSGEHALEIFAEQAFDLILLDVEMPGIDGFDTCRSIRSSARGQDVPVVMMTSHNDITSVKRAFEMGATDFVMKPINWTLLEQRLGFVLRASEDARLLLRRQADLDLAQQIASLGSFVWDPTQQTVTGSPELRRLYGFPRGTHLVSLEDFLERVHEADRAEVESAFGLAAQDGGSASLDHRVGGDALEERVYHLELRARTGNDGYQPLFDGIVQDITRQRQNEERVRYLAYHDSLTGVGNLSAFREKLAESLEHARRKSETLALLFLDLNRFKRINDTHGHKAGDVVLQTVAQRLTRLSRSTDVIARGECGNSAGDVSRLGGDEFTVILPAMRNPADARLVAQRFIEEVRQPIALDCGEVQVGTSIGIAIYPSDGTTADSLVRAADAAMYYAKDLDTDRFRYYDKSMNGDAVERMQIESRLRIALTHREVAVHYQPVLSLQSGEITGVEALARWRDDELGYVTPARFVPVAEECGMIDELFDLVLTESCTQLARWTRRGHRSLSMAVNLSQRQLADRDLASRVAATLATAGIAPERLRLEVTESALVRDEAAAERTLSALSEVGVGIALDDFGTGYSSLNHLRRFPVDVVKIDRSFVSGIPDDASSTELTRAIVAMGSALRLKTVAEGVETETQRDFLADCGCHEEQGFRFSPPVSADELIAILDRQ